MSSSQQLSSFCVFCLKSVQSENTSLMFKYLTCLKRFISDRLLEKLLCEINKELQFNQLVNCCVDCQSLLEAFCDTYSELKHLELQLHWKLTQLIRIMKLASKVPTRVSNLNTILENIFPNDGEKSGNTRKPIQNLRQRVIKSGREKLMKSQPCVFLNRWKGNEDNSFEDLQITASQNKSLHQKSSNEESFLNQSNITLSPTTQSIQQVNCSENNSSANTSTGPYVLAENTSETIAYVEDSDNDKSNDVVDDSTPNNCANDDDAMNAYTETNKNCERSDVNTIENLKSDIQAGQQIIHTQMKLETIFSLEDNLDADDSNQQKDVQAASFSVSDENVPTKYNKSSFASNHLYCSHCKKKFKSIAWLRVHNRKFHPVTVGFLKDDVSQNPVCNTVKTETNLNCEIPSTSKNQGRYNLREKCASKFLTCKEILSDDDNSDKQYLAENVSESSSSTSSESENETETKPALTVRRTSMRANKKSRTIVRKYKPHKKAPVKVESELVNGVKCFRCRICERTCPNPFSLKWHIHSHHKFRGLKITTKEKNETTSLSLNTEPVQTKTFKCNFCEIFMKYPPDLAIHETEHVPTMETERYRERKKDDSNMYTKCPRCKFEYHPSQQPVYIRHHLKTHLKILNGNHVTACAMCSGGNVYVPNSKSHFYRFHNINKLSDPSKISKCNLCSAIFMNARQLYRHTYLIHDQNNHKCEICDKVFETRKKLFIHKRKDHKKWDENPNLPIGCDVEGCKKRFKTQGEFEYHKHFHQNLTPWKYIKEKCLQCSKEFRSKAQLQGHMNKVHCEYVCQLCGKAFKSNAILMSHLNYHKGPDQWKFQCEECGKKCVNRNKLQEHIRTHTKEKPFVCQFCGEKYAHRHNWRNHLKTKHGDEEGVDEEINKRKINFEGAKFMSRKGSKRGDCIIAGGSTEPQKN